MSELERCLQSLYIATEPEVADDVNRIVRAALAERDALLREAVHALRGWHTEDYTIGALGELARRIDALLGDAGGG